MGKDKIQTEAKAPKKNSSIKKAKESSGEQKKAKVVVEDSNVSKTKKTSDEMTSLLKQHPMNQLNEALAAQAIDALIAFTKKQKAGKSKQDLLDTDGDKVHMQLTLKAVPGNHSPKPIQIPVPHAVRGTRDCEMCLFVKKEDKPWIKETLMEGENPVVGLAKVITLDKLRTSYARFEQRRELLATYDMFLADDRILPMLCKTLGKTFFSRKKQPVAVKVSRKESLPFTLKKARDSTYMFLNPGTCTSVCIGTTNMSKKQLLENLMSITPLCVNKVPRKWKNIQAIQLKTDSSMSLPILNKLPFSMSQLMDEVEASNDFEEFEALQYGNITDSDNEEEEEEEEEEKEEIVPLKPKTPKSSKKRRAESIDEVEEAAEAPVSMKKTKTPKKVEEAAEAPVSMKKTKTPKKVEEVAEAPVSMKKTKTPKKVEEAAEAPVSMKKTKTPKKVEEAAEAPVSMKKTKTPKKVEEVAEAPVSMKKPKTPKSAAKKTKM